MRAHRTKRLLDLCIAFPAAVMTFPLGVVLVTVASIETRMFGLFRQTRIGQNGRPFSVYKVRTMRPGIGPRTSVTVANDTRITRSGVWMRRWKLDELPQLWNVVVGRMSLVGPRPDVVGYADALAGEDRAILACRPGITGPATLVFRNEEELLASMPDPVSYNDEHIWPAKVAINRCYAAAATLHDDVRLARLTLARNDAALVRIVAGWNPQLLHLDVVRRALGADLVDSALKETVR